MASLVYTIGHSNRPIVDFLSLLLENKISAVADVRSYPHSRTQPHFNQESLIDSLAAHGIAYVFLGNELGGRTTDLACYVEGKVKYEKLAQTKPFQSGLDRIVKGSSKHKIALMCAEKEPLSCHRCILVARHLIDKGLAIKHIIESCVVEDHFTSLERLLSLLRIDNVGMFSRDDLVSLAYEWQGSRIAFEPDKSFVRGKRESA